MKTSYKQIALAVLGILVYSHSAFGLEFLYQKGEGLARQEYYLAKDGQVIVGMRFGATQHTVPNYYWWHGCSPTSTGMLMGYYDRNGYDSDAYEDLVPGVEAENSTYGNPAAAANDMIASDGHVADFYTGYGQTGDPNPNTTRPFDSLADFMGTSQDICGNSDGGTLFYFFPSGAPFTADHVVSYGVSDCSGAYGIGEFLHYAGYDYLSLYNQKIYDPTEAPSGFTWAQYKDEIDAGRPVLIHVVGHTMIGIGYEDPGTIYLHDTWTETTPIMTWGGSYQGMQHSMVTVVEITGGEPAPPLDLPPVADFEALPKTGCAPLVVEFTDLSTNNPTSWEWDFNNDGIGDRFEQDPAFTYWNPGQYTVRLKVANSGGEDTQIETNYITVTVEDCPNAPVWNSREAAPSYDSIETAYGSAVNGDTLLIQAILISEGNLEFDADKQINLKGGFDCTYSQQTMGTMIENALIISDGRVTVDHIVLN